MKRQLAILFMLGMIAGSAGRAAADDKTSSADQTDNNYYWQGTQLYNLGRLGEAFESFEKAIQRKQNTKEAEAYLLQIRQEIVNNAKKRSEEKNAINYGGNTPDTALNVSYVEKGYIRVTVQAKFLFDENTASLKTGAMDVLNRLADILQAKEGQRWWSLRL
jgi:outer membrane protein assembly factor BamD (BamD/ComL family)